MGSTGQHLVTASSFLGQLELGGGCGSVTAMGVPGGAIAAFDDAGSAIWCLVAARGAPSALDVGAGNAIVVGGATVGGLFVPPISQAASWVEPKGDGPYVLFIQDRAAKGAVVLPSSGAAPLGETTGVAVTIDGAIAVGRFRGKLQTGPKLLGAEDTSAFVVKVDGAGPSVAWARKLAADTGELPAPALAHDATDTLLALDCAAGDRALTIDGVELSPTCPGAVLVWLNGKGNVTRTRTMTGTLTSLRVALDGSGGAVVTGAARGPVVADALVDDGPVDQARWVVAALDAGGHARALASFGRGAAPNALFVVGGRVVVGGTVDGELFGAASGPPGATRAFVAGLSAAKLEPAWSILSRGDAAGDSASTAGVATANGGVFVGLTARGALSLGDSSLPSLGGSDLVFAKLLP